MLFELMISNSRSAKVWKLLTHSEFLNSLRDFKCSVTECTLGMHLRVFKVRAEIR